MAGVLFIVNSLGAGGAEKQVVSLVNHLDSREFSMTLACLHPGDALLREVEPGRLRGVLACHVSQRVDRQVIRQLADLIDSAEIDVIVCTNLYAMLYGIRARELAQRRVGLVEVFHTTILGNWRLRLQMAFYWSLFRKCDRLVYVCDSQRNHWRKYGLRAVADMRIYNGIDTGHFAPASNRSGVLQLRESLGFSLSDYVIGICAGMRPEKAHVDLLAAVARLRDSGVPARCMMIGDGPERAAIERRIGELGLDSAVVIAGFQADVRPYIEACDVMALVSRAVETFSISALEAMALERPMVMSRIGGAAEQVVDGVNGHTFEPGNIDELFACLCRMVDPAVRRNLGVNARATVVERFGIQAMVHGYDGMLRTLLNAP